MKKAIGIGNKTLRYLLIALSFCLMFLIVGDARTDGPRNVAKVSVSVGFSLGSNAGHACALTEAGGVQCWGGNGWGEVGNGLKPLRAYVPQDVTGLTSGVIDISVGEYHSCALKATGSVYCWGNSSYGQLGNGSWGSSSVPVEVVGLDSGVIDIDSGGNHTCALTDTGAVKCWGANSYYQLGFCTFDACDNENRNVPADVNMIYFLYHPDDEVVGISVGYQHTCALTALGEILCWGRNDSGQLGDGTFTTVTAPSPVVQLDEPATAVSAGRNHTCAVLDHSYIYCWGDNDGNQLGGGILDPALNYNTPVNSNKASKATLPMTTDISAGFYNTCAVIGGMTECWGDQAYAQLGYDPSANYTYAGLFLPGMREDAVSVSAGSLNTCAVTRSGEALCWGWGSLGDGDWLIMHGPDAEPPGGPTTAGLFTGEDSPSDSVDIVNNRADAIDASVASLDLKLGNRADAIDSSIATLTLRVDDLALDHDDLDSDILHFSEQIEDLAQEVVILDTAVDNLSSAVDTHAATLSSDIAALADQLDLIEAALNSCELQITDFAPVGPRDTALQFYVHTTLNGARADPDSLFVWVGSNEIQAAGPTPESLIDGVARVELLREELTDSEPVPITVEADFSGLSCSAVKLVTPLR